MGGVEHELFFRDPPTTTTIPKPFNTEKNSKW